MSEIIRKYSHDDKTKCEELCRAHGERRLRSHRKILDGEAGYYAWVAFDGTELVGFSGYNPSTLDMSSFTVINRTFRGRGLASRFLEEKTKHAQSLGVHKFITSIGCTNVPSINLVTREGFSFVKAEDRTYGPVLIFEKELNR